MANPAWAGLSSDHVPPSIAEPPPLLRKTSSGSAWPDVEFHAGKLHVNCSRCKAPLESSASGSTCGACGLAHHQVTPTPLTRAPSYDADEHDRRQVNRSQGLSEYRGDAGEVPGFDVDDGLPSLDAPLSHAGGVDYPITGRPGTPVVGSFSLGGTYAVKRPAAERIQKAELERLVGKHAFRTALPRERRALRERLSEDATRLIQAAIHAEDVDVGAVQRALLEHGILASERAVAAAKQFLRSSGAPQLSTVPLEPSGHLMWGGIDVLPALQEDVDALAMAEHARTGASISEQMGMAEALAAGAARRAEAKRQEAAAESEGDDEEDVGDSEARTMRRRLVTTVEKMASDEKGEIEANKADLDSVDRRARAHKQQERFVRDLRRGCGRHVGGEVDEAINAEFRTHEAEQAVERKRRRRHLRTHPEEAANRGKEEEPRPTYLLDR